MSPAETPPRLKQFVGGYGAIVVREATSIGLKGDAGDTVVIAHVNEKVAREHSE